MEASMSLASLVECNVSLGSSDVCLAGMQAIRTAAKEATILMVKMNIL